MTKDQKSTHTIMVVEDYDDTRLLLKKGLEGLGYSVLEASNGQEAVDIAGRERPDLILMDLDLPDTRRHRSNTAHTTASRARKGADCGSHCLSDVVHTREGFCEGM